ncbi:MAG: AAA family ATPase, partial [Moorellaceae bacterium]
MQPWESIRSYMVSKKLFVPKLPISSVKELVKQERMVADRIRRLKLDVIGNRIEGQEIPLVPYEIVQSWIRSRNYGLDPCRFKPGPILDGLSLFNLLEEKKLLLEAADPYLEQLVHMLSDGRWIVLLSDENGVFLRVLCSRDKVIRKRVEEAELVPGAVWTEATVGTCSHALCTIIKKPIQLWGPEHYTEPGDGRVICSTAPIFDLLGNFTGTLSVSVDSYLRRNSDVLALVVFVAWAIQNRLQNLEELGRHLANLTETEREFSLVIDRNGIITQVGAQVRNVLPRAQIELIGRRLEEVLGKQPVIDEVLEKGEPFYEVQLKLEKMDGLQLFCSVLPIKGRCGRIHGCLVTIKKSKSSSQKLISSSGTGSKSLPVKDFTFEDIIGKSPQILEAIDIAKRAAYTGANILLQ